MMSFEDVQVVTTRDELDKLIAVRRDGGIPAYLVVKYWATGCGPCEKIAPTFEQMAKERSRTVLFASVHWDDAKELVKSEGIKQVPTFQFYKNGARVSQISDSDPVKVTNGLMEMLHGALVPQNGTVAKRQKIEGFTKDETAHTNA